MLLKHALLTLQFLFLYETQRTEVKLYEQNGKHIYLETGNHFNIE